jgi:hypothetical protein
VIFERKDIDVQPPTLCVRCRTHSDIPPDIRERGVAICDDDTVWVKGEYVGRMLQLCHDTVQIHDYAQGRVVDERVSTTVSVGRSR